MADKSQLATAYALVSMAHLVIGLYVGYEATIVWIVSPMQWNEGIAVAVFTVLVLFAVEEYLHL